MSPQQLLDTYKNQSLLYAPSAAREYLRGQCVQSVCIYVVANGRSVAWADAYYWKDLAAQHPDQYEWIPNTATAVPRTGDIVIWDKSLANSGGAGHIDVCLYPLPGTGTFIGVDQNWGGKTVHAVTHNYDKVIGWLRFRGSAAAATPAPAAQGDEMITSDDQARKIYKMLRPNGNPSDGEIAGTVNRRSYAGFVNDAQNEINARDAALRDQSAAMARLSDTVNNQNQTITDLQLKLNDSGVSNADKQKSLDEALAAIAHQNSELVTLHDTIVECQKPVTIEPVPETKPVVSLGALVAKLVGIFSKKA